MKSGSKIANDASLEALPKHERLRTYLVKELHAGRLRPGDALPTELELAERASMSRNTVRQALSHLERNGMIRRMRGRGAFIHEAPSCQNKSISVMRRLGLLCLVFAVTAAPVWARHGTAGCGTTATTPAEVLFLHRQAERARAARPRPLAAATASTNRDIGNVAIIENRD